MDQSEDLEAIDRGQLAFQFELDLLIAHVVDRSLVVIEQLLFLDHEQVGGRLHFQQSVPLTEDGRRGRLKADDGDAVGGQIDRFADGGRNPRAALAHGIRADAERRSIDQFDPRLRRRQGRRLLLGGNAQQVGGRRAKPDPWPFPASTRLASKATRLPTIGGPLNGCASNCGAAERASAAYTG